MEKALRYTALAGELAKAVAGRPSLSRLSSFRGIPAKIVQLLGVDEELSTYEESSPKAIPMETIIQLIEAELGSFEKYFSHLEPSGLVASIGQVHRAFTSGGEEVAVKVQCPGVRDQMTADIALARLPLIVSRKKGLVPFLDEIERGVLTECDYSLEAEHQAIFEGVCRDLPGVIIPRVKRELSTERVLVSEWITGKSFLHCTSLPRDKRRILARNLFGFFFRSLDRGYLHGDLHPRNLAFSADGELLVYDFGHVLSLSEVERDALFRLLFGGEIGKKPEEALEIFVELGFKQSLLEGDSNKLVQVIEILRAPITAGKDFDLSQWSARQQIRNVLGENKWSFRMAGPPKVLQLIRSFSGFLRNLTRLDSPLNWQEEVSTLKLPLPAPREPRVFKLSEAKALLRVEIREQRTKIVSVSLPIAAAEYLIDFIPDLVKETNANHVMDLERRLSTLDSRSCFDDDIFRLEYGNRSLRIWAEPE